MTLNIFHATGASLACTIGANAWYSLYASHPAPKNVSEPVEFHVPVAETLLSSIKVDGLTFEESQAAKKTNTETAPITYAPTMPTFNATIFTWETNPSPPTHPTPPTQTTLTTPAWHNTDIFSIISILLIIFHLALL